MTTILRTLDEEEIARLDTTIRIPAPGELLHYEEEGVTTAYYVLSTKQDLDQTGWNAVIYVKPSTEMS